MASESSLQLIWRRVGPLDLMWLSLFWIVAVVNHTWSKSEVSLLIGLTTFQAFEAMPVSRALTRNKFLWNVLRLLLCYLLIGFTGGLASSYYILLFLPVASAAMALKPFMTLVFTVLAVGSYPSFLVFVDWSAYFCTSGDSGSYPPIRCPDDGGVRSERDGESEGPHHCMKRGRSDLAASVRFCKTQRNPEIQPACDQETVASSPDST